MNSPINCDNSNTSDYDWSPSVPIEGTWECGADEFSKYMSELTIERDCPSQKNLFNKCCIAHDHCYDAQLGQRHCDDIFCDCILVAAGNNEICAKEDVPSFCGLVREFGAEPYFKSRLAAINTAYPKRESSLLRHLMNSTELKAVARNFLAIACIPSNFRVVDI